MPSSRRSRKWQNPLVLTQAHLSLLLERDRLGADKARKSGLQLTPRWREMDSNHRSPARKSRFLLRKANCGTERGQPKKVASYAVPMVRIHLHPALIRSPRRRGRGSATAIDGTSPRKSSSHRTPRWRGLDSNFPFRAQMGFGLRLPDVTGVPRAVASAAMPGHHDRICLILRWREAASNSRFRLRELPTLSFLRDRRRGSQSMHDWARS